jgi:hypothetical protein
MLTGCCCGGAVARLQGVVKALFEHTMLPRVVAGSSVGSIVAGMIATRTDDELRETFRKLDNIELSFFNNSRATELVHSFLQKGALHDMSYLQVCCCHDLLSPAGAEVLWGAVHMVFACSMICNACIAAAVHVCRHTTCRLAAIPHP